MSGSVFSPKVLLGWLAAAAATLALSLALTAMGGEGGPGGVGATVTSRSALGYAGLSAMLTRLGVPVVRDRGETPDRKSLMVLPEPVPSAEREADKPRLLAAGASLVILPKRVGLRDPDNRNWVRDVALLPLSAATFAVAFSGATGSVQRPDDRGGLLNSIGGREPTIADIQLVVGGDLTPVISYANGTLLGKTEHDGRTFYVLADPDLLSNSGLGQGENAALAFEAVEGMRRGGPVVFANEAGFAGRSAANPFELLVRFPFSVVSALGLIAFALLVWATIRRFGALEKPPPPLAPGKLGLIDSSALLLDRAGRQVELTRRYIDTVIADAAARLHAPAGLSRSALTDWLGRAASARGVSLDCAAIQVRADEAASRGRAGYDSLMRAARDMDSWRRELLDGHRKNKKRR